MGTLVLRWSMFGGCGEIVCEARPTREGFQISISNDGTTLVDECVEDQATLLRRSAEIRAKLMEMGLSAHPPGQALSGDPFRDPDGPSTALADCSC